MWKALFGAGATLYGILALIHSVSAALENDKQCMAQVDSGGMLNERYGDGMLCCEGRFDGHMLDATFHAMKPMEQLVFLGVISKEASSLTGAASAIGDSCRRAKLGT